MTLKIVKTFLSVLIVFLYYLGLWSANSTIKIMLFFIMILFIYELGVETGKKQKNRI
ncbi:hypothetical protein LAV72_03225 [Lysinibacillus xylanilyticus]|uniref:hypothetical protein n=1 Tax=Lysinibacillus xylanilyticus TaxID=582475 RepID=UPI002B254059|nr:hypothetical protein [Lysinibacillus xylanilyticus]MEB2298635.1 hypothetical protein [Lysinibacillus xylanilyticus]